MRRMIKMNDEHYSVWNNEKKLNENKIYLDGVDNIEWSVLTNFVLSDPELKNIDKKDIELVLKSFSKYYSFR